jgi:uncharacterized Zn-binding protein involved in type VI secretion
MAYVTKIGSLETYEKGVIEVRDDLRHYLFSNIYEVANRSRAFERVAVAKNIDYVAEAVKVDGESPWYTAAHDEFAIVMDGEITVNFIKLEGEPPAHKGAEKLTGMPEGKRMGRVIARRGHEVLLPKGAAYQFTSGKPGVVLIQTMLGPVTVERWAEICTLG